jgi:hypothetical protein
MMMENLDICTNNHSQIKPLASFLNQKYYKNYKTINHFKHEKIRTYFIYRNEVLFN